MNTTQNRAVITAYVDAFNRGDLEEVCRLFSPDAEIYGVLARGGLDQAKTHLGAAHPLLQDEPAGGSNGG
jgi:hypothetical protein